MTNIRYPTEEEARNEMVEAGRRLYMRGYVCANDGNISARVSGKELWITPSGISKGFMKESDLVKMSLEGDVIDGTRPTSESKLHLEIYKRSPEIVSVIHAHPPVSAVFASEGIALDKAFMQETVMLLGVIPVAEYALPGSDELAKGAAELADDYHGVLLEHHGVVAWGGSVMQALYRIESIEYAATVAMNARIMGFTRTMSRDRIDELKKMRTKWGITAGLGEFTEFV